MMNEQMDLPTQSGHKRLKKRSSRSLRLFILTIIIAALIWIYNLMQSEVEDTFDTVTCYALGGRRPAQPSLVVSIPQSRSALLARLIGEGSLPHTVIDALPEKG
jgi:hypothetical protein